MKRRTASQLASAGMLTLSLIACGQSQGTPAGQQSPAGNGTAMLPGINTAGRPPVKELPAGDHVNLDPVNAKLVAIDQVGYLPQYLKIAVVTSKTATEFKVVDTNTGTDVYHAALGDPIQDQTTGGTLREADFSKVGQPGTYTIDVPGAGRSLDFRIGDDLFNKLFDDAVSQYDVLAQLAPPAWQTDKARDRETAKELDLTGGWPDAGDYGRYMPTAGSSLGTLLLVADLDPARTQGTLDVPGLRQDLPGYLQVLKRELDWVLKVQLPDGSVYHKVTPMGFGGFDKGSDNIGGELFAFEPNTADAAVLAAITAEASRVYKSTDPGYASQLLDAAEKSWQYLQKHADPILPADTEGTGGYVYADDITQRFWAATELFRTTGRSTYGDYARKYLEKSDLTIEPLGWMNTQTYGLIAYYFNDRADAGLRQRIGQAFTRWADEMVTTITSPINPLRESLSEYAWASNKTALDNSVLMLVANQIAPNGAYVECSADQLHYILGRNELGKSFVTSFGSDSVKNPHNRTMFSAGKLVPGVLVGGPNEAAQDGIAPPADGPLSYVDDIRAYSVNENSIEYNAPLVFVTAFFRAR